ncbi:MAG TPA: hypothetical protein ENF47_02960 [Thermoprotei archaeon]|nr:hypothetical protein [Thermoprotei archaeon]
MDITVLVRRGLLRKDLDISDGDSMIAEFETHKIDVDRISEDEYIIRLVAEEDKTLVSISVTMNEYKDMIYKLIDKLGEIL